MVSLLLIEDDENLAKLYKTELELVGMSVMTTANGQRGLEIAKKEKPDLILLDIILPEKLGITVLKELKADETTTRIPVIVLSNFDQGENPKKAMELGAVAFLSKQKYTPQQIAKEALVALE